MKIIAGLGNPGLRYSATRHNCGFLTLDTLAEELDCSFGKKEQDCLTASAIWKGQKLLLAKPQSYMNLSGFPLMRLLSFYKAELADMLVIHDDLDLPPAIVKLRRGGSDGGHNGIKSIIAQAGSQDFNRLKIGVGAALFNTPDYVLSTFTVEEMPLFAAAFKRAAEAALCWAELGIGEAMNRFNHNPDDDQTA